jgi:hypothetical protein
MEMQCAFCEVGIEFLNKERNFMFQRINGSLQEGRKEELR